MDDDQLAHLDQNFALLCDSWPPALWRFYKNCIKEGFPEERAFVLTNNFLVSTLSGSRSQ